jgi:hypothetical protein
MLKPTFKDGKSGENVRYRPYFLTNFCVVLVFLEKTSNIVCRLAQRQLCLR